MAVVSCLTTDVATFLVVIGQLIAVFARDAAMPIELYCHAETTFAVAVAMGRLECKRGLPPLL